MVNVITLSEKKVGMVITGNEVYSGRRKDAFFDVISKKVKRLGSTVEKKILVPDKIDKIAEAILELQKAKCELIIMCGGLSVDADDVTLEGVIKSGARVVSYGAPVMPGAMFLVAELDGITILGAPGAVIYNPATVLDIVLPRVLAGERMEKGDIVKLASGGLCLNCNKCVFPLCHFGK